MKTKYINIIGIQSVLRTPPYDTEICSYYMKKQISTYKDDLIRQHIEGIFEAKKY